MLVAPVVESSLVLRSIAAWGLPDAPTTFPSAPLGDDVWRRLLIDVTHQRLTGLLVSAVVDGALPVTVDQREQARERHRSALVQVLLLERSLLAVAEILDRAGIPYRVLKGPAHAHLYADQALRLFGDIDVLVRSDDVDRCVAVLGEHGYHREWPQLRSGFDRRFGKGATLRGPEGFELDLHRTFSLGAFGLLLDNDDLFATASEFTVGGRRLWGLGAEERFLHACYHAALGNVPPRLAALRDVAELMLHHPLEVDRVFALSRRWRGDAVLARGVRLAWETLDLPPVPLAEWAAAYEPTRLERQALATYVSQHRSYGAKALVAVRVIPGVRGKVAFLRAVVLPERAYLVRRHTSYRAWWGRARDAMTGRQEVR